MKHRFKDTSFLFAGLVAFLCAGILYLIELAYNRTATVSSITTGYDIRFTQNLLIERALGIVRDTNPVLPALALLLVLVLLALATYRKRAALWSFYQDTLKPQGLSYHRLLIVCFLFVFSFFPLETARYGRALQTALDHTFFDFLIISCRLVGTGLILIWVFHAIPQRAINRIHNAFSSFEALDEKKFLGACVLLCFVVTNLFSYLVFSHIPHVQDGIAQLFQAKIFATGQLYAEPPVHSEFFDYWNVICTDRWYSQYPPGYSVLLLLGLLAQAPWIINPLLGALSLPFFYFAVRDTYGETTAKWAGLLFLGSPFFLFMSSEFMSHSAMLLFLLIFVWGACRTAKSDSASFPALAGFALGIAFTIRPLSAVGISLPLVIALLVHLTKKKSFPTSIIAFLLPLTLAAAVVPTYNALTNGSPWLTGYAVKFGSTGYGFGTAQFGTAHDLKLACIYVYNNISALNQFLFEWPVPSLLFIFVFFFFPVRKSIWSHLAWLSILSLIVFYVPYFYQDLCLGPRFLYCALPFFVVLTVRGVEILLDFAKVLGASRERAKATLAVLFLFCGFYMCTTSLPRLIQTYSHNYWFVGPQAHRAAVENNLERALVFMDVGDPPIPLLYGSGFLWNSPDLDTGVIYAIDLREKNRTLMDDFPRRKAYRFTMDFLTLNYELTGIE